MTQQQHSAAYDALPSASDQKLHVLAERIALADWTMVGYRYERTDQQLIRELVGNGYRPSEYYRERLRVLLQDAHDRTDWESAVRWECA